MRPQQKAKCSQAESDRGKHLFIGIVLLLELLPLYMMLQIATKSNSAFLRNPWLPESPAQWEWLNWVFAGRTMLPYLLNSFAVSVATTCLSLASAVCAAFFFSRYRLPGARVMWYAFLFLMLMPSVASLVPLTVVMAELSLLNSLLGFVLVGIAASQVFNIYVLRGFAEDLPGDLFDAAEMDGATPLQQIVHVLIPQARDVLGTLAVLSLFRSWNEFMLPLILLRDERLFTVGVGLIYLDGEHIKHWGAIMAAYSVATAPLFVLLVCFQKAFVRGFRTPLVRRSV